MTVREAAPRATEAELLASVKRCARAIGARFHHHRWSLGSDPGWPDVVIVDRERRTLWLFELKGEKNPVTEEQAEMLEDLSWCERIEARLVRPADWPALRDELIEGRFGDGERR